MEIVLYFAKMDIISVRLVVLPDVSFANSVEMKSELGFIIISADR